MIVVKLRQTVVPFAVVERRFSSTGDSTVRWTSQMKKKRYFQLSKRHGNVCEGATSAGPITKIDAAFILAGGQTGTGGVPVWVESRLKVAAGWWKNLEANEKVPIVALGAGSPHKNPVMNSHGQIKHESVSCTEILLSEGIAAKYLYKETSSYDTIGNAYFSLIGFAIPRKWRTICIFTNDFHMERTRAAFDWVFHVNGAGGPYELHYFGADDVGIDSETKQARLQRERKSTESVREKARIYTSMTDLHEFIHHDHGAYSVEQQHNFGKRSSDMDDTTLQSY